MSKKYIGLLLITSFVLATACFGISAPDYIQIGGKNVALSKKLGDVAVKITVTTWSDPADAALPCSVAYYDYWKEGGITHQGVQVAVGSTTMPTGTIAFYVLAGKSYKVKALKGAGAVKTVDLGLVNSAKSVTIHFN